MVTTRLSRDERRGQLLDAAAQLVSRAGVEAISMEGVAAAAGVSKALPYRHFEHAGDLLAALHERELGRLARRVDAAMSVQVDPDDRLRAGVHAYFEVLVEHGQLLGLLGSTPEDKRGVAARRVGPRFMDSLLTQVYGPLPRTAEGLGATLLGALLGATEAWGCGEITRRQAERIAGDTMVAAITAAVGRAGQAGQPIMSA